MSASSFGLKDMALGERVCWSGLLFFFTPVLLRTGCRCEQTCKPQPDDRADTSEGTNGVDDEDAIGWCRVAASDVSGRRRDPRRSCSLHQ